ncbi:hypothetical protein K402DRAFT_320515 [Aulographum hederae CBS 113979]|uniref:Uncharacterized protein n=1 Tax=Aulographum hederae CBS 113979 TaxID=1176131 RepID=A0A6G1HG56_9PEZI|nr:hypothetical protein K402DRAFT_320515 [Aulographum hederae CBS 113979]
MSYADMAAKGPKQSPEEVTVTNPTSSAAPQMPEVEHTDESTSSLIDVDSPHISSVPSDFESQSVKTDTQADRIEREAEDAKITAEKKASEAKEKAKGAAGKAKSKAGLAGKRMNDNKDNPVVIGNAVLIGLGSAGLGYAAYQKYTAGEFTWKVAGAFAGIVGVFATADYFISSYLFQKYPPKK